MKLIMLILTFLFAAFMIYAGVMHFKKPEVFLPFIPDFMPKALVNYGSGAIEILLGIGLFIPAMREKAAFALLILMVLFLPLHIIDVFSETPAIGSHKAAMIRLPIQFVLILLAWGIWKYSKAI